MICRQTTNNDLTTSSNTDDESNLSINMSSMVDSSTMSMANIEKALKNREKELHQREAQLRAYQEQVMKVEKLAEDATRIGELFVSFDRNRAFVKYQSQCEVEKTVKFRKFKFLKQSNF